MSKKNVITKKRVRSSPQATKTGLKKPRPKAKRTERAAQAGFTLATRSFELAKGSLATLLRELKEECGRQYAEVSSQ